MPIASNHSPTSIPTESFSALAGKLQETAEVLLSFCHSMPLEIDSLSSKVDSNADKQGQGAKPGEYRQYHLPPHTLSEEIELFKRYKVENIADALNSIYNDLFSTVFLMKGYEDDEAITSFRLCLIAEQMSRSLDMLSKVGSVLADYNLEHATRVSAT